MQIHRIVKIICIHSLSEGVIMTKRKVLLCLFILLSQLLTACTLTQQDLTVLDDYSDQIAIAGDHKILLENTVGSDKKSEYCKKNGIDEMALCSYLTEYEVIYNGEDNTYFELPIFDPSIYKNILAVSCNVPVKVEKKEDQKGYKYLVEVSQIPNNVDPFKEGDLIIRYLMNTEFYDYKAIPESAVARSIKLLKRENIKTEFSKTPLEDLAFKLRSNLTIASQNSVREIVKCYRQWITKNIGYPDLSFHEDLIRLNYVNIDDPLRTLALKIGVCEDNAKLLQALLETQGIETEYIVGYDGYARPGDIQHAVMGVELDSGTYMIDPTAQSPNDSRVIEIEKDLFVSVGVEISDSAIEEEERSYLRSPMIPMYHEFDFSEDVFYFIKTERDVYRLL